jgi:hypothetical protein
MTYRVTDDNDGYNKRAVKILFIPYTEDIDASKAQTPYKLQEQRSSHVAEIKRDGDNALSRLDDVKKTGLSSYLSNTEE